MAQSDEDGLHHDRLPLQGVVLCSTSLPADVRTKLADVATQMGAVHKLDLTADVTHLIVGSITTPKYRYVAKERATMKVLHPDFIESVRQAWMEGGDVDILAIGEKHKLGAFHGLRICVTGFTDEEQRTFISETVALQGATYHPDLTKSVTHLIAALPTGPKYDHAKLWKMPVVSWKWFEDSLRRGMALDEALYDPAMPVEEQGKGAYLTTSKSRVSLGKRTRDDESQTTEEVGKRKLRRTASTRLHSQSQDMWQDLSTRDGNSEPSEMDQWNENSESGRSRMSRTMSEQIQVRRSDVHSTEASFSRSDTLQPDRSLSYSMGEDTAPGGLFTGRSILIRGFPRDRTAVLKKCLEPDGASIVETVRELENASQHLEFKARYLLMPHAFAGEPMQAPDVPPGTEIVTEWWVERCVLKKQLIEPSEDVLSRPLWEANIPDFAGLSISATGLGFDFRQAAEAIKLMGATYEEKIMPSVSVLISSMDTANSRKVYYAEKHKIHVVSIDWLWECLKRKQKVSYDQFRVTLSAFVVDEILREASTSNPGPSDVLQGRVEQEVKRKEVLPKRLSNTRKRHATPSLSLQAAAPAPTRTTRPGPFIHEDEEDIAPSASEALVGPAVIPALQINRSQPLQELSPNSSPRKANQAEHPPPDDEKTTVLKTIEPLSPESAMQPTSPKSPRRSPATEPQHPPTKPREELAANLAALIHRQPSSRPDSANSDGPARRKNRPLGRSASGIGNRTFSSGSVRSEHAASPGLPSDAAADSVADGYSNFTREPALPPGTQLGYETADAEAHRLLLEKRMKGDLQSVSSEKRVASVGTVKDSFVGGGGDGGAGVGARVKGRSGRTKT